MMADQFRHTGKTFGQVIRERRIELGITQEQLAERIGENVRQSDVSRMERDYITLPRRDRLEALAAALDVTPGYLLMHSGWITSDEQALLDAPQRSASVSEPDIPVSPATPGRDDDVFETEQSRISSTAIEPTVLSPLHDVLERARIERDRTGELLARTAAILANARRTRRPPDR